MLVGLAAELTETAGGRRPGVRIREVTEEADLRRIGELESEVWDEDWSWLAEDLIERRRQDADGLPVFAAEAAGRFVAAAWLNCNPGTEFAGLGAVPRWPTGAGRGIYRALVAVRARRAVQRGVRYLQVDASPDSEPILRRLGFVAITTTRPYVHHPPG